MLTFPKRFMRFLPFACLVRTFFFIETSPPYKPTSEVSQINNGLIESDWSQEMQTIMQLCEQTKQETNGYFNVWYNGQFDPSGLVKGWAIQQAARLLKQLSKKWRSLSEDLLVLQAVIATLYKGANGLPVTHICEAFFSTKKGAMPTVLSGDGEVVKVRLDSQDLDSDKLRVTYIRSGDYVLLVKLFSKNELQNTRNRLVKTSLDRKRENRYKVTCR